MASPPSKKKKKGRRRGPSPLRGVAAPLLLLMASLLTRTACAAAAAFAPGSRCSNSNNCRHRRSPAARRDRRPPRPRPPASATAVAKAAVEIGLASVPGSDPERPQKVNQDAHFAFAVDCGGGGGGGSSRIHVVGVMDGHGLKGHLVTRYLRRQLPRRVRELFLRRGGGEKNDEDDDQGDEEAKEALRRQVDDLISLGRADPSEFAEGTRDDATSSVLRDAFLLSHLDALGDPSVPAGRSGTTCVVCAVDADLRTAHVAWVGDSRAVLGADDGGAAVARQTRETTVNAIPAERERVERSEGRIDAGGNVFYGPVGIAMTRSLGDAVMLRAGVLPVPVVARWDLPDGPLALCAGTDGVFDVLSSERVLGIIESTVDETGSVQAAAEQVCRRAREAWLADLPIDPMVDDITCAVLRVQ
jgi:serine/threonine protein phosphatase PrpC